MLLDDYVLTKFIGKGTFGEVYLTKKKNSEFLFATKRMSKELIENPKYIKYFNNEISILKNLYHKNIVRLEGTKKTMNHYYVIMEYCNGGTLTENLEKYKNLYHKPFTEEIVQHVMRQVVSAINYIHDLRIIHRDLKLDNILVKYQNDIDKNQINLLKAEVKIIDFGFAAIKNQAGLLQTAIGSPMNMDPLILKKYSSGGLVNKELGYDEKADIWSLGTLCYQMLLGNCAFDAYNMSELVTKIEEGTYKIPTYFSKEVVSFLNAMLQYKPEKRLSASQLIKHAFLIKNVSDFTRINIGSISNKVYGGQININIKNNNTIWSIFNEEDEKKLSTIPGEMSAIETPLSQSQYLDNINTNGEKLITKSPYNLDKDFIDKEFKMAESSPFNGMENEKANSSPLAEKPNVIPQEQNIIPNNIGEFDNLNNHGYINTPLKQTASPVPIFQINKNNFFKQRVPNPHPFSQNCIKINVLNNFGNKQIPIEEDKKIPQQINKNVQPKNEQMKMNLLNKLPKNQENLMVNKLNKFNPNQLNANMQKNTVKQLNYMNLPPNISPSQKQFGKIQFVHMKKLQTDPNIHHNHPNQIQNKNNQPTPYQIHNNEIQKNQFKNNQNQVLSNKIQFRMQNNQINPINQIQNKQIKKLPLQNNKINNQFPNNNKMINNQFNNNQHQENQIQNNLQIKNNFIQNKQVLVNQFPAASNNPKNNITPNKIPQNKLQIKHIDIKGIIPANLQNQFEVNRPTSPQPTKTNTILHNKLIQPLNTKIQKKQLDEVQKAFTYQQTNQIQNPQSDRSNSPRKMGIDFPVNQRQFQVNNIYQQNKVINQAILNKNNVRHIKDISQDQNSINLQKLVLRPKPIKEIRVSPGKKRCNSDRRMKIFNNSFDVNSNSTKMLLGNNLFNLRVRPQQNEIQNNKENQLTQNINPVQNQYVNQRGKNGASPDIYIRAVGYAIQPVKVRYIRANNI